MLHCMRLAQHAHHGYLFDSAASTTDAASGACPTHDHRSHCVHAAAGRSAKAAREIAAHGRGSVYQWHFSRRRTGNGRADKANGRVCYPDHDNAASRGFRRHFFLATLSAADHASGSPPTMGEHGVRCRHGCPRTFCTVAHARAHRGRFHALEGAVYGTGVAFHRAPRGDPHIGGRHVRRLYCSGADHHGISIGAAARAAVATASCRPHEHLTRCPRLCCRLVPCCPRGPIIHARSIGLRPRSHRSALDFADSRRG